MKLRQGIESLKISKPKFAIGICIGVLYAFLFYSILYLSRESIRFASVLISDGFYLWIFTDEEVKFYNFFFAFLSLILGQSICFQFWAERKRKFMTNYKEKLTTIINDQRFLMWCFLSWFSKLAFLYGFVFIVTLEGGVVFSFYQGYKFIFILFLIVLFLQSWLAVRRFFKRNSLKWMTVSFILISILSLGLSTINLIDYKALNKIMLRRNIIHEYNIKLPRIANAKAPRPSGSIQKIYLAKNKDSNSPIIIFDRHLIGIDSFSSVLINKVNFMSGYNYDTRSRWKYQLYIDKEVQMEFVTKMLKDLAEVFVFKFSYSALPVEVVYDKSFYRDYSINHYTPYPILELDDLEHYENKNTKIKLEILSENKILIDDSISTLDALKTNIQEKIKKEQVCELTIEFGGACSFGSYINVLSLAKQSIEELRNEYAFAKFHSEYETLSINDRREVAKVYNLVIIDSMK